jgi:hypothetical protein
MKKDSITKSVRRNLILILGIVMVLSGCKSSKKDSADAAGPAVSPSEKEAVILDLTSYPLPTATEITDMLQKAGASYILSLSNPADRVGNYLSSAEKALNLGIYGTDLSYACTYMMKQETMKYLESSKKLIDDLEISTTFKTDYVRRVEDNLDSRDSLINIISDSFVDTWDYLVDNEQDKLALMVVIGSYIEGLYITSQIALTATDNTAFLEIIAHQKKSLDTLIGITGPVKEDRDLTEIHNNLTELAGVYEDVGDTLTNEQLEEIVKIIDPLRESIV